MKTSFGRAALAATLVSAGALAATAQIRREPLIIAMPFGVLNPQGSPIELAEGTMSIGSGSSARVSGDLQPIRLRSKEPMLPMTGVVVRVAAGLFEEGMLTYRLQMVDVKPPESPSPNVTPDPAAWTVRMFMRIPGETAPDLSRVGRKTKFLMTVEQVTDVTGKTVFDNSGAREQLWRALGGR
jgi:hypothetical protein